MHRLYAVMDYNLEMMELRMQKQLKEARKQARSNDDKLPPAWTRKACANSPTR